jgi:hypothetical protein
MTKSRVFICAQTCEQGYPHPATCALGAHAHAGASGFIAAQMWQLVVASVAPVPSGILLGLSGALAAFCAYNIIAGGNPPPKKRDAA